MNNKSESSSMGIYRAASVAVVVAVSAFFVFGRSLAAVSAAALLAFILIMGLEYDWFVKLGDRWPAISDRLRGLYYHLISFMPVQAVELGPYDVIFGWDARNPRKPVTANLLQLRSFLIYGVNGAGKTSLLHAIIHDAISILDAGQLGLVIFDPKDGHDFSIYRRIPHLLWPIADTEESTRRSLKALAGLMESRGRIYSMMPDRYMCNDMARFNQLNRELGLGLPELTPVLVIIDEIQKIIKQYRGSEALIESVAKLGRAYGVFIVPSTQLPKADAIPTEIKAECFHRFVGLLASPRLYGSIAEVPKDVYESFSLREHQFFYRTSAFGWGVMTTNVIPYDVLELQAESISGKHEPAWPDGRFADQAPAAPHLPAPTAPQIPAPTATRTAAKIEWPARASAEKKHAILAGYLLKFTQRPTAVATLDDIDWSLRTAEKWLPIVWGELRREAA